MTTDAKESLFRAVGKYGLGVVMAFLLLYIVRYDMILPANEERKENSRVVMEAVKSLTASYERMSRSVEKLVDIQEAQATTQKTSADVLKELKDQSK